MVCASCRMFRARLRQTRELGENPGCFRYCAPLMKTVQPSLMVEVKNVQKMIPSVRWGKNVPTGTLKSVA